MEENTAEVFKNWSCFIVSEGNGIKISVIIPVYEVEEQLLDRCLNSLLEQTEKKIEVLIVCDMPGDRYRKLVDQYRNRGMRIRMEEQNHQGVSAARNRGLKMAEGQWISFTDADDWLSEDALEKLCRTAEENQAEIVMGEHRMEYGSRTLAHSYQEKTVVFEGKNRTLFEMDTLRPQTGAGFVWGKLFSKSMLDREQLFFQVGLSAAEDAEFMFRAACAASRIAYITDVCYHYWFNPASAVRKYRSDYAERYICSMEALRRDIEERPSVKYCLETYYSCVLYHLLLIVVNYSFHPESPKSAGDQVKEFRELLKKPIFKEALEHIHYGDFSKTRQITLLCVQLRLYSVLRLIVKVRHRQFRQYSGKQG